MTTKEFIQYAMERRELCEKMSACVELEEAYAIAKAEGLADDMAAFAEVMAAAKKDAEALSDKDLNDVTAAGSTEVWLSVVTSLYSVSTAAGLSAL